MLLCPSWCTRPHKSTVYRALQGQSGRVKKCGRLSSLRIFFVQFPFGHSEHARQASYFSEPSSPSSRLLYFIQIFLLPVLRCVVLQPCLAYLLSSSLSLLSYTRPIITVNLRAFCPMQTRTNRPREPTAARTFGPLFSL